MNITNDSIHELSADWQPAARVHRGPALTRVSGILPFVLFLRHIGAPVARFLSHAKIPDSLLDQPNAALPLHQAYIFAESAARSEGIENFGLVVGQHTTLDNIGPYGHFIQQSNTVYEYLKKGIELISSVNTSERFWLSQDGETLRFNHYVSGSSRYGQSQCDLYALIITINTLRKHVDASWQPKDLHLTAGYTDMLPKLESLPDTKISGSGNYASFELPRSLLNKPIKFNFPALQSAEEFEAKLKSPLAKDFVIALKQILKMMIREGNHDVAAVAEACCVSVRTLQRHLAEIGLSYRQLTNDTRIAIAANWLKTEDVPIAEIAYNLGYSDPSNFTRAFRRQTGISPQEFRSQDV